MPSICLYDVKDKDLENIGSFESDVVPPVNSKISMAENTEEPKEYLVIEHRYTVLGDKLRVVFVGVTVLE